MATTQQQRHASNSLRLAYTALALLENLLPDLPSARDLVKDDYAADQLAMVRRRYDRLRSQADKVFKTRCPGCPRGEP